MDPATFQLILLTAQIVAQLLPLLLKIDISSFTPTQKIEWEGMIARIKASQNIVTPYQKEPVN